MLNNWEYGIAIGVLAIILPLFGWIVKTLVDSLLKKKEEVLLAKMQEVLKRCDDIMIELKERDRKCSTEHTAELTETNRLNNSLSELVGMLNFILDHFMKRNGIANDDASKQNK